MDRYLTVPGAALTIKERNYLKKAVELACRRPVGPNENHLLVNIGVMWGASMHCLRAGSKTAKLVGIDLDYSTYPIKYRDELRATFMTGDSRKLHQEFDDGNIDLLFVDGSHKYDNVKADILGWSPKVIVGGLMIFHDYRPKKQDVEMFPNIVGVKKAVNEWWSRNDNWIRSGGLVDSIIAFRRKS